MESEGLFKDEVLEQPTRMKTAVILHVDKVKVEGQSQLGVARSMTLLGQWHLASILGCEHCLNITE